MRVLPIILLTLLAATPGRAATPLDDGELAAISARDGIVMNAHLQLGTQAGNRLSLGFQVQGQTLYLLLDRISGTLDLLGLELKAQQVPDHGDVMQIGLPSFVGFKDFGVRAIGVQADPAAPLSNSLGQIQLNGTAQIQGQLLLWAR